METKVLTVKEVTVTQEVRGTTRITILVEIIVTLETMILTGQNRLITRVNITKIEV